LDDYILGKDVKECVCNVGEATTMKGCCAYVLNHELKLPENAMGIG